MLHAWLRAAFEVKLALLLLILCGLYAITFTHLVYVSLLEQVLDPRHSAARFAGPTHYHSPAEWVLLVAPALIGWFGVLRSGRYLLARRRREPSHGA